MPEGVCRILSLDGGGAKGFYSLGVLAEVEAVLPHPIHKSFDLIFGTSTGSIIATLLATGKSVEEIHCLYREHVPHIMQAKKPRERTRRLRAVGEKVFGEDGFDTVRTGLGVVTTKWQLETPMIFKSMQTQAHGRRATFVPGFGCTLADAVEASCSAYPFFERKIVRTSTGNDVELFDGGYVANNPALYALADATGPLGFAPTECRVLSIGCGQYPEPRYPLFERMKRRFWLVQLLQKTLEVNTASMDQLRQLLFATVPTARVSDHFNKPEMATDLFEHDLNKLNLLRQQGGESFGRYESQIRDVLFS